MKFPKPWDVGVRQGDKWLPLDDRVVSELQVGRSDRLADLAIDLAFYTPAMLYSKAGLQADLHETYLQETGLDGKQATIRFERPIFSGFDVSHDPEWNHVLYGISRSYWDSFKSWLGTIALAAPDGRGFLRVRFQDISVADPLFSSVAAELRDIPLVPCTVLCMETPSGSGVVLCDAVRPWLQPSYRWCPNLRWQDTAKFAAAITAGSNNPYKESDL